MKITVFDNFDIELKTRKTWELLVRQNANLILGLDVTMSYEWLKSVWENQEQIAGVLKIVVIEDKGEVVAIGPFYESKRKLIFGLYTELVSVAQLYCGREGFLIKNNDPRYFSILIRYLLEGIAPRTVLKLSVVDGSYSSKLLNNSSTEYKLFKTAESESPYIVLPSTWDDLYGSLKKKLRYNIRNSEKKLNENGSVIVKVYDNSELDGLFEAILSIERQSWKETAGTSITQNARQEIFYKKITPIAASKGWLKSFVLYVNEDPIAYVYGLVFDGVYYDLKESVCENYKNISPGQILKKYVFKELCESGVKLYDFMGKCESYKMQWTNDTYSATTYLVSASKVYEYVFTFKGHVKAFISAITKRVS